MAAQPSTAGAANRLADIQAITDAALASLDEGDFLPRLLERVVRALQADTAAVLLLDRPSGQLTAVAAAGLEEEVTQGVRIPVGAGFAGRIAATRSPVILDRVDQTTVVNPILIARGIRSLLGVPLLASGQVIGVLHVGSLSGRRFTGDDADLLQLAADRAAVAVQSMLHRTALDAALALQRSLLPGSPPAVPGAQIAVRYVAGQGVVGGDWYDVFTLPDGRLGLVIGDVAGSGLPAAVIMGRIRSALRAYALETSDPAEVLDRLDRKMQHFEPGALATVLYAVATPDLDRLHIASAGHLPPVLMLPGRAADFAPVPPGLMIGVATGTCRQAVALPTPPGSLLCLYTDGLIERPRQPLDDSMELLRQAVTDQQPDAACAVIMDRMIGRQHARDDVALLIYRPGAPATVGSVPRAV